MSALSHIRVLDLSRVLAGPWAGQLLGDLGAEVIKVERPGSGDDTRHWGPPYIKDAQGNDSAEAAYFQSANRNKQSLTVDFTQAEGQRLIRELAAQCDVVLENFKVGGLAAYGLDYAALKAVNPKLIYCSITGFGQDGPYADLQAYDDVIQGMSGLADLMEQQGGEARYLPTIAADKTCGHVAAHAILAALWQRERTGEGAFVEVPMFESMVGFNLVEHFYGQHFEPPRSAPGYPRVLAPWRRPYHTADGLVAMMPYTNLHWQRFFAEVGAPQHADDPRFSDIASRTAHIAELLELASTYVRRQPTAYWLATCERLEIPAAPVARLAELRADEHLLATGFFEELQDAAMGTLRFPGVAVRFDGQRPPVTMAPRLGEHTRALLAEVGLDAAQVQALIDQGAAIAPQHKDADT